MSDIKKIKAEFSGIETITLDAIARIRNLLSHCDAEQIKALATADIKFVSKMAQNRI